MSEGNTGYLQSRVVDTAKKYEKEIGIAVIILLIVFVIRAFIK